LALRPALAWIRPGFASAWLGLSWLGSNGLKARPGLQPN
jgi:hypothetical protein